ncbi:MAG: hypothetical protein QM790_09225 [Nibricoccus sp.]
MKNAKGYVILLVLAAVFGGGFLWERAAVARLRAETSTLKADVDGLERLKELNTRYKAAPVVDTTKLQRDADSLSALQARKEELKETLAKISAMPAPTPGVAGDFTALWKNAGQAKPADTLRSIIWASLNGDVDALSTMLFLEPETREVTEALWASLPEAARAQYPTSQKLIATLVAGRLTPSLFQMEMKDLKLEREDLVKTRFVLQSVDPIGLQMRSVELWFQRQGADWRLVVPKKIVAEFQRTLQAK